MLAGKLHAILQRDYVKGRDWYDLYWYLRQPQWPSPNFNMLNQSLAQSGWDKGPVAKDNWREHVQRRLDALSWQRVVDDVQRFVIEQQSLPDFNQATIERLLTDAAIS